MNNIESFIIYVYSYKKIQLVQLIKPMLFFNELLDLMPEMNKTF